LCFVGRTCLINVICIDLGILVSNTISILDVNRWNRKNDIQPATFSYFQYASNHRRLCRIKNQSTTNIFRNLPFPSLAGLSTLDVGLSLKFYWRFLYVDIKFWLRWILGQRWNYVGRWNSVGSSIVAPLLKRENNECYQIWLIYWILRFELHVRSLI